MVILCYNIKTTAAEYIISLNKSIPVSTIKSNTRDSLILKNSNIQYISFKELSLYDNGDKVTMVFSGETKTKGSEVKSKKKLCVVWSNGVVSNIKIINQDLEDQNDEDFDYIGKKCITIIFRKGAVFIDTEKHDNVNKDIELNILVSLLEKILSLLPNSTEENIKSTIIFILSTNQWIMNIDVAQVLLQSLDQLANLKESDAEGYKRAISEVSNSLGGMGNLEGMGIDLKQVRAMMTSMMSTRSARKSFYHPEVAMAVKKELELIFNFLIYQNDNNQSQVQQVTDLVYEFVKTMDMQLLNKAVILTASQ